MWTEAEQEEGIFWLLLPLLFVDEILSCFVHFSPI